MAKTKIICLCTPSLGAVSIWWAQQVADMMWPMNCGRRNVFMRDAVGGEIAETRNKIVAQCLAFDSEKVEIDSLFWVDDDVLITRAALLRLYEHRRPIASGVYFTKGEPGQALIFPSRLGGTLPFIPDKVYESVWGHGMGLTLVRAEVYRRMRDELRLPLDKYGSPEWYKTVREYKVEDNMLDCGGTEDLYFLEEASKIGSTSLVDCGKWTFGFHFNHQTQQGYPTEQFNQWSRPEPVKWRTEKGEVSWE